ncbi:rhodanese-like domain-containing protein [Moraxella oblonga]|uniref:rhodanese-like domain-containing protein n=1 Tax=Moraxella oblonga TaxID=200413 RepID=UPI000829BA6D|nr:rhodanese-like domain-containing protein [Moraxella oblonga]
MIKTLDIANFTPNADLTIWDVRVPENYNSEHIAHAQNVPIENISPERLAQTTGDIYILCGGGTKAEKACQLLESIDPNRTYIHLTGGTRGAKALGWTLITEN